VTTRLLVTAIVCWSLGNAGFVAPAQADGRYEVEVPVDGRGPDSEIAGLTAAMSEILTRITGDPTFAKSKKAEPLLNDPHKYVGQYGFRTVEGGSLVLKAQFDQKALEGVLRQAGVKFSNQQLPSLLVWLVTADDNGAWRFVGSDDATGYGAGLKSAAMKRRLPVILPLLDLEDETHVTPDDVVNTAYEKLSTASLRYGTRAMLTGALRAPREGQTDGQFNLVLADGRTVPWTQQGQDVQGVLSAAVDWAADYLAKNRLPTREDTGNVELVVEGVNSLDAYMRVLRYLRAREQVANVTVKNLEADRVTFIARPQSSNARMTESLADGLTLEATSTTNPSFRLLPGTGPG
jgi:uncharacterized protein